MRTKIVSSIIATTLAVTGVVAGSQPVSAAAAPIDLANAIVGSGITVTGASFVTNASPAAVQVRTDPVAGFPVDAGGSYAVFSTGDADLLTQPNDGGSQGSTLTSTRYRTASDVTTLKLDFDVQPGFNCLASLQLRFLSEEFPEFVGSRFNDAVIVELDVNDWSIVDTDVVAPHNIAFVGPDPITVNASGPLAARPAESVGTAFDAATPILSARSPITAGPHSLYITIFDQGDSIYDSVALVDDLRAATVADPAAECPPGAFATNVSPPNRFVPITPDRVIDTRVGLGLPNKLAATQSTPFKVTGTGGVPSNGVAGVVLNVTATRTDGRGFVRVTPTGGTSNVSNLNIESAGQTLPNLVTVPVSDSGSIDFFSLEGTHLVVDVFGYYTRASAATAGRFIPTDPSRLLDTRSGVGVGGPGAVPSNGVVDFAVSGQGGVPATGAAAVVLNVTVTGSTGPGYVTAWASGTSRPPTSNLNVTGADQTIPNQVIVPIGADGRVSLFALTSAHLIADVAGYFTDDTAGLSTTGLFIPITPARLLDTREANGVPGTLRPAAGSTVSLDVIGRGGVPTVGAAAIVGNTTATQPAGRGFVTVFPSGISRPDASTVNVVRSGQTIANHTTVKLGEGGVDLFTLSASHLILDVSGFYTD